MGSHVYSKHIPMKFTTLEGSHIYKIIEQQQSTTLDGSHIYSKHIPIEFTTPAGSHVYIRVAYIIYYPKTESTYHTANAFLLFHSNFNNKTILALQRY